MRVKWPESISRRGCLWQCLTCSVMSMMGSPSLPPSPLALRAHLQCDVHDGLTLLPPSPLDLRAHLQRDVHDGLPLPPPLPPGSTCPPAV